MKLPKQSVKKTAVAAAALATVAALAATGSLQRLGISVHPVPQQTAQRVNDDFKKVAKWAVWYADMKLGMVEGKATCIWEPASITKIRQDRADQYSPGHSSLINPDDLVTTTRPVQCEVRVRNPQTGQLHVLSAKAKDLKLPDENDPGLHVVLHGQLPGDRVPSPPAPALSLRGAPGETATISIKNGATESNAKVDISATAAADSDQVTLALENDGDGMFTGRWQYAADPLTERNASGDGAAGIFDTLRDEDVGTYAPNRPGGFLGFQRGRMVWRPLPPAIFAVHVLEDQAAFAGATPKYPHRSGNNYDSTRTLVIIGRDLPMFDNDPIFKITGQDAIQYEVLANSRAKDLSSVDRQLFERGWREVTSGWDSKEADDFRKLDAVLVRADLRGGDPGPKRITWGTAQSTWTLQYGDNTAVVTFKRVVGVPEQRDIERYDVLRKIWGDVPGVRLRGGPLPAKRPDIDAEVVTKLALPERVFIEIETGTKLEVTTIPIIVGSNGIGTVHLTATRVKGTDTIYRTPSLVFGSEKSTTNSGDTIVQVPQGARVFAAVDGETTHFLRATPAEAGSGPAGVIDFAWTDRLKRAAGCAGRDFDTAAWPAFARQPAEASITFGDHAAMILLRDAFVGAMRAQIAELQAAVSEPAPRDASDRLVDAWYRSMEPVVWKVPDYPLTALKVASPAGPVAFSEAYSDTFKENTFRPWTTADGESRYLTWRRQASREAIKFALQTMAEATAKAQAIETCDRTALLKLTGSGFRNAAARMTPLLMKLRSSSGLAEPDYLARAYVSSLGTLTDLTQAQKELTRATYAVVVTAASLVVPPLAGAVWGAAAVAGKVAVGGLALLTYESANQIYETYQEHDEVRFAFGAYATLGVDRYFDAASRATPWWQTGVAIFGNALLLGAPVAGQALSGRAALTSEGLAIWRGERVLARLAQPKLAALRGLPAGARRDVAMALLDREASLVKLRVVSAETEYLTGTFDAFGREARGLPVHAPDPIVELFDRPALAPADDFSAATRLEPPNPIRLAETQKLADSALLDEARTALADTHEEVAEAPSPVKGPNANVHPPLLETGVPGPTPMPLKMPNINQPWAVTITVDGRAYPVLFSVGDIISKDSLFFIVYELKSLDGLPPELLGRLRGKDLVLKVLKKNSEALQDFARRYPGAMSQVAERMMTSQRRLVEAKQLIGKEIPQEMIQGWDDVQIPGGDKATILLQEKVAQKPGEVEIIPSSKKMRVPEKTVVSENGERHVIPAHTVKENLTDAELQAYFKDPGKQEAVAALYKQLIEAKLGWLDGHFGNIVLRRPPGGRWVASVLDQDMIGTYQELNRGFYGEYLENMVKLRWKSMWKNFTVEPPVNDVESLMYKMFEAKAWLRYDTERGMLEPRLISPTTIKHYLPKMPYLDPPAVPAGQPKRGRQRRPLDLGALRDLADNAAMRARNVLFARPAWAAA